ncbi:MAG: hypothetical protein C5B46_05020 [Proteobacteria bacterium]|nr:MAG: hypothetical protein C5B46_05020 [Pseudomonadota bacterium]
MSGAIRTLIVFLGALAALSPAAAQEERCYPGPPIYILRELMGGVDTPQQYREAVLSYAKEHCGNGQTLKLVSPAGLDDRDKLNEQIALSLCERETIYRETLARGEKAIVLFCLVSKLGEPQPPR